MSRKARAGILGCCSREKSKPISIDEGIAIVSPRIQTEAVRCRFAILLLNFKVVGRVFDEMKAGNCRSIWQPSTEGVEHQKKIRHS